MPLEWSKVPRHGPKRRLMELQYDLRFGRFMVVSFVLTSFIVRIPAQNLHHKHFYLDFSSDETSLISNCVLIASLCARRSRLIYDYAVYNTYELLMVRKNLSQRYTLAPSLSIRIITLFET